MSQFAFYQEVRLARPQPTNAHLAGRTGAILGIGRAPGEPVCYGLAIEGEDQIVTCEESELEATGRQFRREDFYADRPPLRVRVDRRGRGELA
jgi:hypothetical protein